MLLPPLLQLLLKLLPAGAQGGWVAQSGLTAQGLVQRLTGLVQPGGGAGQSGVVLHGGSPRLLGQVVQAAAALGHPLAGQLRFVVQPQRPGQGGRYPEQTADLGGKGAGKAQQIGLTVLPPGPAVIQSPPDGFQLLCGLVGSTAAGLIVLRQGQQSVGVTDPIAGQNFFSPVFQPPSLAPADPGEDQGQHKYGCSGGQGQANGLLLDKITCRPAARSGQQAQQGQELGPQGFLFGAGQTAAVLVQVLVDLSQSLLPGETGEVLVLDGDLGLDIVVLRRLVVGLGLADLLVQHF